MSSVFSLASYRAVTCVLMNSIRFFILQIDTSNWTFFFSLIINLRVLSDYIILLFILFTVLTILALLLITPPHTPHTALNVDSTVFFEIYHASKQSFLYLKEFYIGELAVEDRILVPPSGKDGVKASEAFLEQLNKLTKWRLKESDMILYKNQKSF